MAALVVTADKYANADSAMKIQVALDEAGKANPVPPSKPDGERSRQQHHHVGCEVMRLEVVKLKKGAKESARREAKAA